MAYSLQIVHRARRRLESMKADHESVYRERLQTVYEKLPRVRQIDMQLRRTMVLATQAVFEQGDEARGALEDVKKANLALQQEREMLITQTFGEGYLGEETICSVCGGVGYLGSTMCRCLQELCRDEQKKELALLACEQVCFADFKLEYYPDCMLAGSQVNVRAVMQKTFQDCVRYAQEFGPDSGNLLFSGDTGLGKTFLSACIADEVSRKGYSVKYESAPHLFEKLEKAKFSGDTAAETQAQEYATCDLLIIDDLGTEMGGQFVTTALYTLLNDRLMNGSATIISTNLTAEEMGKRYSPQIVSRLRGSYKRMAFIGDDIRVKKNWGGV